MNEMQQSWEFTPIIERITCSKCGKNPHREHDRDGGYVCCDCEPCHVWYYGGKLPVGWVLDKDYLEKKKKVEDYLKSIS